MSGAHQRTAAGPTARPLHAPGPGALAVIEVVGPGARVALARALDRPPPPPFRHALGALRDPDGGDAVDQVVVAALGEDRFEVAGHAGRGVVARALAALERAGFRLLAAPPPTDFLAARTLLAARALLAVAEGRLEATAPTLARPLRRLAHPARAVLVGAPNAGKSTLFNALIERERSITSPVSGTTRDVIEVECAFAGVPIRLADMAGIGAAEGLRSGAVSGPISRLAADRAEAAMASADVAIFVLDGAGPLDDAGQATLARVAGVASVAEVQGPEAEVQPTPLVVLAKRDLGQVLVPGAGGVPASAIPVSARTGDGLDGLQRALARAALGCDPADLERLLAAVTTSRRGPSAP